MALPESIVRDVLAPTFLTNSLSLLLYGVVIVMGVEYFSDYWDKDRLILRIVVIASLVVSLGDTVGSLAWAYLWGVTNWGNPRVLTAVPWCWNLQQMTCMFAVVINQSFFSWRIYTITSSFWVPGLVLTLAAYYTGVAFWTTIHIAGNPTWEAFLELDPKLYRSEFGISMSADVVISAAMVWYLIIKPTRNSGQGHLQLPSNSIFKSIVLRTIQFNILSLLVQLAQLIISLFPSGFWFMIPYAVQSKVYALSIIISLTSRGRTGRIPKTTFGDFTSSSQNQSSNNHRKIVGMATYPPGPIFDRRDNPVDSAHNGVPIQVFIEQKVEMTSDTHSWTQGEKGVEAV